jgi:putative transposase
LTVTHVRRWHAHHHSAGTGPIYQGRFKSFPVQEDDHFYTLCRYVERNPLRANLVARAENWRWSSLWHRVQGTEVSWLVDGPLAFPSHWTEYLNRVETEAELAALRSSVARGAPFGKESWQAETATILGLESALRRRGRPKKSKTDLAVAIIEPDPFFCLKGFSGK